MPELIENGPNIPVQILNKLENEQVIFFVGAGISAGKVSNLPTFKKLIRNVYNEINIEPDGLEKITLDWENWDNPDWSPPFIDRTFQLLERKRRVGGDKLRQVVANLLSKEPERNELLKTHKALLDLSDTASGFRLVTTNFDNRFCEAACQNGVKLPPIDIAPRLPVANTDRWSSIVHLHGSISSPNLKDLVLTSADFGRAYITHGWATKFLIDLFRHYTVIFAGYSIEDPVMRYLIDAIAAQPRKEFNQPFVFAPFNGEYGSDTEAKNRWQSMGVEPILFDRSNDYRYLHDTLIEWARIYRNPLHARKNIVLDEIRKTPKNRSDPIVERLLWALQESSDIAQDLADNTKIEDNDQEEFTRVASWLDIFFEEGFIGGQCKENHPCELSMNEFDFKQPTKCWKPISKYNFSKEVEWWLIKWVLKLLHIPQVFSSVYCHYLQLPTAYRRNFKYALMNNSKKIPKELQCLWFVLLNNEHACYSNLEPIKDHYHHAEISERSRYLVGDKIINYIVPKLAIANHSKLETIESFLPQKVDRTPPHEKNDYKFQLVFCCENSWSYVQTLLENKDFRIQYAETLTDYLERSTRLIRETVDLVSNDNPEKNRYDLHMNRPSIAEHDQNRWQTKSMKFVDFVRDSYFDLVEVDEIRAEHLLQRWMRSGEPLFKRLALHAMTENRKDDIQYIRHLLLDGDNPGLLDQGLERETLRFLRKAGSKLPKDILIEITELIRVRVANIPKGISQVKKETQQRRCALRLFKLTQSGVELGEEMQKLVDKFKFENVEVPEFSSWIDFVWISDMDLAPEKLIHGSVNDMMIAIKKWDFKTDKPAFEDDVFRDLFIKAPQKVLDAVCRLAKNSKFILPAWAVCLQELNSEIIRKTEMIDRINQTFESFTGNQIKMLNSSAPSYIKLLATECEIGDESEFSKLWFKVWNNIDRKESYILSEGNVLIKALNSPAGYMTEAALTRLQKYSKSENQGLPASVKRYFDKIASADDGHLGRVILARELFLLYGIDPKWTEENLIPQMSQAEKTESQHLWLAFSSSQKIGPNLLAAIEGPLVNILLISKTISDKNLRCQLTELFMLVCLWPQPISLKLEDQIIKSMPEDMLETVLSCIVKFINRSEDENADNWQKKVGPWLDLYWPRLGQYKTMKMSELMLEILAECGSEYSEAAEWFLEFLVPVKGYELYNLKDIELTDKSAETTLKILRKVVDKKVIYQNNKSNLKCILDKLSSANPKLSEDARFISLYKIARS